MSKICLFSTLFSTVSFLQVLVLTRFSRTARLSACASRTAVTYLLPRNGNHDDDFFNSFSKGIYTLRVRDGRLQGDSLVETLLQLYVMSVFAHKAKYK